MGEGGFAVVFKGELVGGFEPGQVRSKVAEVLGLSAERLEAVLAASRVVLEKDLSEYEAARLQDNLARVGLTTYIERLEGALPAATAEETRSTGVERFPFRFHGEGGEFFRIWIVNLALTILTLGIYSAWAKVRTYRYFYGNTELAGSRFDYLAKPINILKGRLIAFALFFTYVLIQYFFPPFAPVAALLFMLVSPWFIVRSLAFRAKVTRYRGVRFGFNGTVGQAFVVFALLPLGAMVTFGLLFPYVVFRQHRFLVDNSRFGAAGFVFHGRASAYFLTFLLALGILLVGLIVAAVIVVAQPLAMVVVFPFLYLVMYAYLKAVLHNLMFNRATIEGHGFASRYEFGSYAELVFTNTLAIVFTVGLFYPWARVRTAAYAAEHMALDAAGTLDHFVADQQAEVSAAGEEIGDLFDVEFGV